MFSISMRSNDLHLLSDAYAAAEWLHFFNNLDVQKGSFLFPQQPFRHMIKHCHGTKQLSEEGEMIMKSVVFRLNLLVVSWLLSVSLVGCTHTVAPANPPSPSKPATAPPATDSKSPRNNDHHSSGHSSSSTSNHHHHSGSSMKISFSHQKMILQSKKLAREGRVLNTNFQVEKNTIDQVEAKYGKGKIGEAPEPWNRYVTYPSRNLSFGVNKGEQIYDIRSYDPELQKLRLWEVKKVLGKPDDMKTYQKQAIYIYQVTKEIQLKWIFSSSDPYAKADHISVVNPQLSKNYMAN